jgi:hypothetical protein
MRAIVIREGGGPEVLVLEEAPDPVPGEGQVLVRVEAAAVNHFDLTQRGDPAATGTSPPFTPGVDAAGTRLDTGERVLVTGAPGAYADLLAAPSENVWRIPDSLEIAPAAALGVAYKTAWAALTDGELQRGDTLLRSGRLKRHRTSRDRHRTPPRSDGLRHRERGEARPPARAGRRTARLPRRARGATRGRCRLRSGRWHRLRAKFGRARPGRPARHARGSRKPNGLRQPLARKSGSRPGSSAQGPHR